MNLFSRLQNNSARVLSVGPKPLEDRIFSNLSLQSLIATFEDIQTARNSFGDWVQQKTHLHKAREKLFLNLDLFFNQVLTIYSFSNNSKIKDSPLYQKIKFSKQKGIHSIFQKIDQWMTVGDFKKQVQTFDSSFIELLHSKNFISTPHPVKDIHLYGLKGSTALAFYGEEYNHRKTIFLDHQYRGNIPIFEGVQQGWKRCFILAHEAGHLEFSNESRFSYPQLGPNLNEEVQKQMMGLERNPFSLFFEEMTVEAFAAASLLKISQFSTEGVKAVKDFKKARELSIEKEQILFSEYAKSVNSERSFIVNNDVFNNSQQLLNIKLNLENIKGRIGLENIKKIPHAGCSLGIDLVLNHLDELKNIEPSQIMGWICQKTSEAAWNYWTESNHLKEYQVTPGDGLNHWINQKKYDFVGIVKRDSFIRNTILDQLIGLNDENQLIMRLQKAGIPSEVHDLFRQQNSLICRAIEKLPENLIAHQKIIESFELQKEEHLILLRLKEESINTSLELIQKHVTSFLNEQQTHPDFMSAYLVSYKEKWNRLEQSFNAWQNEKKDLTAKESSIPEFNLSIKNTMANLGERRKDMNLKENEPTLPFLNKSGL